MEGFVPLDQLGKPDITRPADAFSDGEMIPLKSIEFDPPGRRIVFSVAEYYKDKEKAELEVYLAKHPTKTVKVKELMEKPQIEELEKKLGTPPPEEKKSEPEPGGEKPPTE
jgi:ribosomal protein S1